jgi:hypothetical protein
VNKVFLIYNAGFGNIKKVTQSIRQRLEHRLSKSARWRPVNCPDSTCW